MNLFDAYSDMADEVQAEALVLLKELDPEVHDALVHLLVADVLAHELDVPPWLAHVPAMPAEDDPTTLERAAADAGYR